MEKKISAYTITGMAVLTAIVVVLQLVSGLLPKIGPFQISLVLAPIIIGAALYGYWAGAWLGLVFGAVVLLNGDAALFLAVNIPGTIITVLLKGICAGLAAGAVYRLIAKKNKTAGVVVAGIAAPVANTGIFLLGCLVFFLPTIQTWAGDSSVGVYMITGLVGFNFLVELAINLVLSSVIVRIIQIIKRQIESNKRSNKAEA